MENDMEIWKAIPEWSGFYEVSNLGSVRGIERSHTYINRYGQLKSRVVPSKIIKARIHKITGRAEVKLTKNNKTKTCSVSRLVCSAFHGPCPDGKEAAHLDGNCLNNDPSNLAWVTHKENIGHKVEHGTNMQGSSHHMAKLTEADVISARGLHKAGATKADLARQHKVTFMTMSDAIRGITWSHI